MAPFFYGLCSLKLTGQSPETGARHRRKGVINKWDFGHSVTPQRMPDLSR
jgi:hypothetical protein